MLHKNKICVRLISDNAVRSYRLLRYYMNVAQFTYLRNKCEKSRDSQFDIASFMLVNATMLLCKLS